MDEQLKNKVVYQIIANALLREPIQYPDSVDWDAVYTEMQHHKILPLAGPWLMSAPITPEMKNEWTKVLFQSVFRWKTIMEQQQAMFAMFEKHGVKAVVMKGAAAAKYYPIPEQRTMGDIDFMVLPEHFDQAVTLMEEDGFQLIETAPYHLEYRKDGVNCEIHRYPSGMKADNSYLMNIFVDGIHHSSMLDCRGYKVPEFPALQNGLVFLLHIVQHMGNGYRGLGLRQFYDWMMYAYTTLNDEYYHKEFEPVIKKAGLKNLAVCVTRMCQIYFGLTEEITWCKEAVDSECEFLMKEIMLSGNFGRKQKYVVSQEEAHDDGMTVRMQYYKQHPLEYLSIMQKRGKQEWKLLKKFPFLTPFAWAYKLCTSIGKAVKIFRKGNVSEKMKQADEKTRILTKLGLIDIHKEKVSEE